ncbi:hypothetical protein RSAG8_13070, partial [Rhizoctonia solani AG-8 WAC10335]
MPESQEYGTVARFFMDSPPGIGKRATKYDKGPFFTFYKGDYRGAWSNYCNDVLLLISHNESKGIKPSFCKAYTWTEVKFVIENMVSFKEIIWHHGNNRLKSVLIDTFNGWDNVYISKELHEHINKYPNPLPLAPNETAPPPSTPSSQSSELSLSQPPIVRTPVSSQGFSPTRPGPPSSQSMPSWPGGKRLLFASPHSSQGTPAQGTGTNKRPHVVHEDISTATNVLWMARSLSMGATYQLELIDGLVEELLSLRHHFELQAAQSKQATQSSPTPKTPQNPQVMQEAAGQAHCHTETPAVGTIRFSL